MSKPTQPSTEPANPQNDKTQTWTNLSDCEEDAQDRDQSVSTGSLAQLTASIKAQHEPHATPNDRAPDKPARLSGMPSAPYDFSTSKSKLELLERILSGQVKSLPSSLGTQEPKDPRSSLPNGPATWETDTATLQGKTARAGGHLGSKVQNTGVTRLENFSPNIDRLYQSFYSKYCLLSFPGPEEHKAQQMKVDVVVDVERRGTVEKQTISLTRKQLDMLVTKHRTVGQSFILLRQFLTKKAVEVFEHNFGLHELYRQTTYSTAWTLACESKGSVLIVFSYGEDKKRVQLPSRYETFIANECFERMEVINYLLAQGSGAPLMPSMSKNITEKWYQMCLQVSHEHLAFLEFILKCFCPRQPVEP